MRFTSRTRRHAILVQVLDELGRGDARVVDEDVDRAERLGRPLDHVPHLARVGHVHAHREGAATLAFDATRGRRRGGHVDVGHRHRRAGLGEGDGDPRADARPGPGHDRDAAGQLAAHLDSSSPPPAARSGRDETSVPRRARGRSRGPRTAPPWWRRAGWPASCARPGPPSPPRGMPGARWRRTPAPWPTRGAPRPGPARRSGYRPRRTRGPGARRAPTPDRCSRAPPSSARSTRPPARSRSSLALDLRGS